MECDKYQLATARTRSDNEDTELGTLVLALGLMTEAAEAAEMVKKCIEQGRPLLRTALAKELGDTFWYLARLADRYGLSLDDIAQGNLDKLKARYPDGFVKGGGVR